MWKISKDEFVSKMVHDVILCAQRIQEAITQVKSKISALKGNIELDVSSQGECSKLET